MHCDVHGIAAGPDGLCALCRASLRVATAREGRRLAWFLLGGLAAVGALLLAYRPIREHVNAEAPTAARSESSPVSTVLEPAAAPTPDGATSPPALTQGDARRDVERAPLAQLPLEAPSGPSSAGPASGVRLAEVQQPDARDAPSTPTPANPATPAAASGPSPERIRSTLLATPILMYTAPWCGVCRRAHAFLQENGLSCTDRDIEASPFARSELKRRTGALSVPTFEVDGTLLRSGFSERSLEQALSRSVERRLGVRGVRIQMQ